MKKQTYWIVAIIFIIMGTFYVGRYTTLQPTISLDWNIILSSLFGPLAVGYVLWYLGTSEANKKVKRDAVTDLMTYRGDKSSLDFTKSLNKVSIIFHDDEEIRTDVKKLYEVMNDPTHDSPMVDRYIVGLIHKLCKKHGFPGLTEYDIDQSFIKFSQTPNPSASSQVMSQSVVTGPTEQLVGPVTDNPSTSTVGMLETSPGATTKIPLKSTKKIKKKVVA